MMIQRINPSEIPAAFRRSGITPITGAYTGLSAAGQCGACLLGVLATAATSWEEASRTAWLTGGWRSTSRLADLSGLDREYAAGLNDGWEGFDLVPADRPAYNAGYEDGQMAYRVHKPDVMMFFRFYSS